MSNMKDLHKIEKAEDKVFYAPLGVMGVYASVSLSIGRPHSSVT